MEISKPIPLLPLRFPFLLLLLISLVLADGVITEFFTGFGLAAEGNPLMRICISEGHFLLMKVAGGILSALILWDIYRKYQRLAITTSLAFIAFYTIIVYWNITCIFISGGYLQ